MTKPTTGPADYDAEMRFGVVMYGGVSLAIYIYGVSNEIFELACATPLPGRLPPADGSADGGSREIYRRLSLLASDPALRSRYAVQLDARTDPSDDIWPGIAADLSGDAQGTRFVVDVIAGTSAGGINGIFLAKALAKAQTFAALGTMWIDEGDIGALLNDGDAWKGLPAGLKPPKAPPASLLSSDRMYLKLLKAFGEMVPPRGSGDGKPSSPLVEELDLFVTTTDIDGAPVPLRLFDKVVYERRHRQRFHFSYPSQIKDLEGKAAGSDFDFDAANHPFLAFAARCTSSFPFAFEPMTLQRMCDLSPTVTSDQLTVWQAYFDGLTALGVKGRPFGDGGYLDNKPFSYVAETLSERFGDMPAQRKLMYVEPSPEPLQPDEDARPAQPNAVQNALSALLGIPQYETIREDLNTVLQRNRRIDRVEGIARQAEEDVERRTGGFMRVALPDGKLPAWKALSLDEMLVYYGPGFAPYWRLRVYAVSDWLAKQLAAAFGVDGESDRGYALRAVVRGWRESYFADNPQGDDPQRPQKRRSVNAFLIEHDVDYRLRRLTFLMRRIDRMTRMVRRPYAPWSDLDVLLAKKMDRAYGALNPLRAVNPAQPLGPLNPLARPDLPQAVLGQLQALKAALRTIYRSSMQMRRDWAGGMAVQPFVDADPLLRRELDNALTMLLGQPLGDKPEDKLVRTVPVDGKVRWVEIPQDLAWLQSGPGNYSLQDSVMHRIEVWLSQAREAGQPPLQLWDTLSQALNATRIDQEAPNGQSFEPLLFQAWNLIGQPRLRRKLEADPQDPKKSRPVATLTVVRDATLAAGSEAAALSHALRLLLGEWFLNFDSYDQTRYTLYYDTGTGEPATVDVVRVSPVEATTLRAYRPDESKLAGTGLAHFGAFLDESWRRNDIMWGRLDGAERLIQTVLPGPDDAVVRQELIRLAHDRILTQTLKRRATAEITGWLAQALNPVEGLSPQDKLQRLLSQLGINPGPARDRLAAALPALMAPEQLRLYASEVPTFDPHPPMDRTLRNAARAVTVTGRVLEGVSLSDVPSAAPLARWASRLGLVLQGAMVVAVPGTLGQRLFAHILPMVYGFELLLLAVALLFGDAAFRFAALSALGVTAGAHLLTLLLRDAVRQGHGGKVVAGLVVAVLLLVPAAFGVLAYLQQGSLAVCGLLGKACWWLH
jgi:patatin-related protein